MNTIETFMFASINAKKNRLFTSRTFLLYGAAGISMAELARLGIIEGDGKIVTHAGSSSSKDPMLDEVLDAVIEKGLPSGLNSIISSIPRKVKRFGKRPMEELESDGYIHMEPGRFIGIFPYVRYVIARNSEHERLVSELKDIILKEDRQADPQKALLVTMLFTCGVFRKLFDRRELEQVGPTLKKVGKGEFFEILNNFDKQVQKAVKSVIAAAQSASF